MGQLKQQERIEVSQDQVAAVLSFAERHRMSPIEVLRRALELYVDTPHMAKTDGLPIESDELDGQADSTDLEPIPRLFSRHPGRDYSSFGSMKDELPDGVEYQKAIREEW